jgi:hypothetical protein
MAHDWKHAGINFSEQAGFGRLCSGAGAEITHGRALAFASQRHAAEAESGVPLERLIGLYTGHHIYLNDVHGSVHDHAPQPGLRHLQQNLPLEALPYTLMDRPLLLQKGTPPKEDWHHD